MYYNTNIIPCYAMSCQATSWYVMLFFNQFEPAHFLLEWDIFAENSVSEEPKKLFHPLCLKKKGDIFIKNYNFISIKTKSIIFTSAFITTCLGSAWVKEQEPWKKSKIQCGFPDCRSKNIIVDVLDARKRKEIEGKFPPLKIQKCTFYAQFAIH